MELSIQLTLALLNGVVNIITNSFLMIFVGAAIVFMALTIIKSIINIR